MTVLDFFFELLDMVPMPWQISVFIIVVAFVLYGGWRLFIWGLSYLGQGSALLLSLLVRILLLPEYWITSLMRLLGGRPIGLLCALSDFILTIGEKLHTFFDSLKTPRNKTWRFRWGWVLIIAAIPPAVWYARDYVDDPRIISYIDSAFNWWYELKLKFFT